MSKRLCVSLLSPLPATRTLQQCSALRPSTVRGDTTTVKTFLRPHDLRRQFSLTTPRSATVSSRMRPSQKAAPSISVAMKQQQKQAEKDGSVLDHIGVLDGTFIYPTGKNLPSLISNPRGRFTIEVKRIWTAVLDWGASLVMRVWVVRPKMWSGKKLERGKVVGIATEIYEEMYTGLAKGDLRLVEQDLKPGLLASLRSRLAQRAPNSGMLWKLHGYTSRPKVMSFKFITLPGGSDEEKNGVVQAVVRLRSKQSLVKVQKVRTKDETGRAVMRAVPVDEAGVPVPEAGMEELMERNSKVTTEYVVLQRMMKKGKFERWQMWGTAEESSLAKLERDHRDAVAKQEQMAQMRGQT